MFSPSPSLPRVVEVAGANEGPPSPSATAVTAKVQQLHAAGSLGKLTIPELKAYLKSMKLPVGGKKAELEERVRQSFGGGNGA